MEHVLHPQPGYPFTLALEHRVRALGGRTLGARRRPGTSAPTACPYGCGAASVSDRRDGDRRLGRSCARRAATVLLSDERGIPIGLRAGRREPSTTSAAAADDRRDEARQRLHRPRARRGRPRPRRAPRSGRRPAITLWVDESYRYLMLFTGDTLPDVNRRSLAVEPMTCPPNAFRTGESVIRLEPGESITTVLGDRRRSMSIRLRTPAAS